MTAKTEKNKRTRICLLRQNRSNELKEDVKDCGQVRNVDDELEEMQTWQ
jgi:hypothetical protein